MRYNRDFKRWKFSTDRIIETEEYQWMIDEYDEFRKKMLHVDIRDMNHELYGMPKRDGNESTGSKIRNAVITILVIGAFISCAVALILKQILVFGILFCSLFFVAGAIMVFTGQADTNDTPSKKIRGRIIGIFIMLGSGAILSLILLRDRFLEAEMLVWIASAAFGLAGLCLVCLAIIDKLSDKIIYKEEIDAKCIGYIRMVDSQSDSDGGPPMTYMYISPVFEYSYEGQRIEAVYDTLQLGDCCDIELDSYARIRIDPKHPEDIMGPNVTANSRFVSMLIFGIIFSCVGSGLAWYSLLGGTKDLTVETSWNELLPDTTEAPAKQQINDEAIEANYADDINGKDWYFEVTTVVSAEDYQGNLLLTFDDSFEKMLVKTDTGFKAGDDICIFYTVAFESEDQTEGYKCPFVYTKPSEVEYTGSHTAFKK